MVEGLKQRGLTSLLERYCRDHLRNQASDKTHPARAVRELVSLLVQQGARSGSMRQRQKQWQEALDLAGKFLKDHPGHPVAVQLRLQQALAHLSWGLSLVEQSKTSVKPDTAVLQARRHFTRARVILLDLEGALAKALEGRHPGDQANQNQAAPTWEELYALQTNGKFRLAQVLLQTGLLCKPGSGERAKWLHEAQRRYEPFTHQSQTNLVLLQSLLDTAICQRARGQYKDALATLARLRRLEPAAGTREMVARYRGREIEQRVRIHIDRDDPLTARSALEDYLKPLREANVNPDARTQLLHVEVLFRVRDWYLELAQESRQRASNEQDAGRRALEAERSQKRAQRAADAQKLALYECRTMGHDHGPYWALRAERLTARFARSELPPTSLEDAQYLGRSLQRSGRFDLAAKVLSASSQQALAVGQRQMAADLHYRTATAQFRNKQYVKAAQGFASFAESFASDQRVDSALYLGARAYGAAYLQQRTQALAQAYQQALGRYVSRRPQGTHIGSVRWLQGKWYQARRQYRPAAEAYSQVPSDDERSAQAREAALACFAAHLRQLGAEGKKDPALADRTVAACRQHLARLKQQRAVRSRQIQWTLRLADLLIQSAVGRDQEALDLLNRLERTGIPDDRDRVQAQQIRMHALLHTGNYARARSLVRQWIKAQQQRGGEQILKLLSELLKSPADTDDASQSQSAEVVRMLCEHILERTDQYGLPDRELAEVRVALAKAYRRLLKPAEALEALAQLTDKYASKREVAELRGHCQIMAGQYAEALHTWLGLLETTKPVTRAWYEAKYQVVLAHFRMGQYREVAKIVGVTKLLHPDLGGPDLRTKFLDLERRSTSGNVGRESGSR